MAEEKPLNVRVAEALGWKPCAEPSCGSLEPPVNGVPEGWSHYDPVPPYGEDSPAGWICTGPLLDRIARMSDRVVITQSVDVDGEFTHLDAVGPFLSVMVQGGVSHVIAEWVAQHGKAHKNG